MKKKPKVKVRLPWKVDHLLLGGTGELLPQNIFDDAEVMSAMNAVFDQQQIARGDWAALAFTLALRGGFIEVKKQTGQLAHWNLGLRWALWLAVRRWSAAKRQSLQATFADAAFLEWWGRHSGQHDESETLSTRYYETQKPNPMVKMFRAMRSDLSEDQFDAMIGALLTDEDGGSLVEVALEDAKRMRKDQLIKRNLAHWVSRR